MVFWEKSESEENTNQCKDSSPSVQYASLKDVSITRLNIPYLVEEERKA